MIKLGSGLEERTNDTQELQFYARFKLGRLLEKIPKLVDEVIVQKGLDDYQIVILWLQMLVEKVINSF